MTTAQRITRFEKRFDLPAPPAVVFAAWVDAGQLRQWLCDDAAVEPRVGGRYRFWGKSVPWIATPNLADGVIDAIESPNRLVFHCTLRNCLNRVNVRIDSSGAGSSLNIEHIAEGDIWPRQEEAPWVLADFWRLAIGNLHSYLKEGAAALRTDFTDPSIEVAMSITINAPVEKVFAALSVPELMDQWISKSATVDLRPGGAYRYGWTVSCDGKNDPDGCGPRQIVELIPNRLIVHDWQHANEPVTRVRWELEPLGNKTRLTLRHARYDDKDVNDGYRQGWAAFLVELWQFGEAKLR